MDYAEQPESPFYASDSDSCSTKNGSSPSTNIGFSPATSNEQDAPGHGDKNHFGQIWVDSTTWNKLDNRVKERFFPEVGSCRHLSEHPQQSGWYVRRLLLHGVLDTFRAQAWLDHVTADFHLVGRHGQLSELSYHFRNDQDIDIARINITPSVTEDPSRSFQLATTWALQDALLPSYYLLSQALHWPNAYTGASYCQTLDRFNASPNWKVGTPTGPYELPGTTLRLRVVPQTSTRLDLAWVRPTVNDSEVGYTFMIIEFHLLEAFPTLQERMSLHTAILLLGSLASAILGRDVQTL